jgi:hypothetical protein
MTDDNLTARVENLEKIAAYLHRRLYRAERRLLMTGTLLTHADEVSTEDKKQLHHEVTAKLREVSLEFSSKLRDLDKEEPNCCPMLAGRDADDQTLS